MTNFVLPANINNVGATVAPGANAGLDRYQALLAAAKPPASYVPSAGPTAPPVAPPKTITMPTTGGGPGAVPPQSAFTPPKHPPQPPPVPQPQQPVAGDTPESQARNAGTQDALTDPKSQDAEWAKIEASLVAQGVPYDQIEERKEQWYSWHRPLPQFETAEYKPPNKTLAILGAVLGTIFPRAAPFEEGLMQGAQERYESAAAGAHEHNAQLARDEQAQERIDTSRQAYLNMAQTATTRADALAEARRQHDQSNAVALNRVGVAWYSARARATAAADIVQIQRDRLGFDYTKMQTDNDTRLQVAGMQQYGMNARAALSNSARSAIAAGTRATSVYDQTLRNINTSLNQGTISPADAKAQGDAALSTYTQTVQSALQSANDPRLMNLQNVGLDAYTSAGETAAATDSATAVGGGGTSPTGQPIVINAGGGGGTDPATLAVLMKAYPQLFGTGTNQTSPAADNTLPTGAKGWADMSKPVNQNGLEQVITTVKAHATDGSLGDFKNATDAENWAQQQSIQSTGFALPQNALHQIGMAYNEGAKIHKGTKEQQAASNYNQQHDPIKGVSDAVSNYIAGSHHPDDRVNAFVSAAAPSLRMGVSPEIVIGTLENQGASPEEARKTLQQLYAGDPNWPDLKGNAALKPYGAQQPAATTAQTHRKIPGAPMMRRAGGGNAPSEEAAPAPASTSAVPIGAALVKAATAHGVPPLLLFGLVNAESSFNPRAKSSTGAMGLGQLEPGTAADLGVTDPYDVEQNANASAKYLRQQLDRFHNIPMALAAYNAGPGAVLKHRGIPPYKETRDYVAGILDFMRKFGQSVSATP